MVKGTVAFLGQGEGCSRGGTAGNSLCWTLTSVWAPQPYMESLTSATAKQLAQR